MRWQGVKKAVVHLYNSTSLAQREQVFRKEKPEIIKIATDGATADKGIRSKIPRDEFLIRIFSGELHGNRSWILQQRSAMLS